MIRIFFKVKNMGIGDMKTRYGWLKTHFWSANKVPGVIFCWRSASWHLCIIANDTFPHILNQLKSYVALCLRGNETDKLLKTWGNVTDKVFQKSEVRTREVLLWRWCGASRVLGVISCLCICKQHLSSTPHTRKLTRPCQTARGETRVSLIGKTEGAQLLKEHAN